MKYIILFSAMILATSSVRAQTDSVKKEAILREWAAQHELKDSLIARVKRDIAEALLEPDESIHRQKIFETTSTVTSVKKLREELARQYKRRVDMDKEYRAKYLAVSH